MGDRKEESRVLAHQPFSATERALLRKLADRYYGIYLLQVVDGIIHNLNGPLQILYIRSEQLEQNLEQLQEALQSDMSPEVGELVTRIEKRVTSTSKSLNELNAQLRHLTSDLITQRPSEEKEIDIKEVMEECIFLLNANMFFKHRVNKTFDIDDSLPVVKGRKTDICIIILTLVQNALEAMEDADCKDLKVEVCAEKGHVIIRVQDTGCGVSEDHCQDICKVGFTTKSGADNEERSDQPGGFGLSLVSLLLEDYSGSMAFESRSGTTTFTVQIPCPANSSEA